MCVLAHAFSASKRRKGWTFLLSGKFIEAGDTFLENSGKVDFASYGTFKPIRAQQIRKGEQFSREQPLMIASNVSSDPGPDECSMLIKAESRKDAELAKCIITHKKTKSAAMSLPASSYRVASGRSRGPSLV